MSHEDELARMYQIMARLAEIEKERELILRRRDIELWKSITKDKACKEHNSTRGRKSWVTRRANLAVRREAA